MAATADRSGLPALRPDIDPASAGMSVRSPQAVPTPPSGSIQTAPSDPAHPKNASDESPRECVPDPSTLPFPRVQRTGHFTSYKLRTGHELATPAPAAPWSRGRFAGCWSPDSSMPKIMPMAPLSNRLPGLDFALGEVADMLRAQ